MPEASKLIKVHVQATNKQEKKLKQVGINYVQHCKCSYTVRWLRSAILTQKQKPKEKKQENDERQILAIPPSLSTLIHDQKTQIDTVDIKTHTQARKGV